MRYYLSNLYLGRVLLALTIDWVALVAAALATWIALEPPLPPATYAAGVFLAGGLATVLLYYAEAYELTVLGSGRHTLLSIVAAFGVGAAAVLLANLLVPFPGGATEILAHFAALYAPLLVSGRVLFRLLSSQERFAQRVLLIGNSDLSRAIARAVRDRRKLGTEIIGILSDDPDDQGAWIEGYPVIGPVHELDKVLDRVPVDRIVVASKKRDEHFPASELLRLKLLSWRIDSGVSFYERVTGRMYLRDLRPSYLIFNHGFALGRLSMAGKRLIDIAISSLGLVLAGPVIGLAALAVRLDSPGPAFFGQQRVGRGGGLFKVWKLRSMCADAEEETGAVWSHLDDERVTRLGRFLRKARLDELPQLWNVLRGEMSLVGPRPERPEFVDMLAERYPYFRARSAVRPGITGWAQIRDGYVNDVAHVEEKLALDFYYLKYRSLTMDLLILWKTLKTVLLLRGL